MLSLGAPECVLVLINTSRSTTSETNTWICPNGYRANEIFCLISKLKLEAKQLWKLLHLPRLKPSQTLDSTVCFAYFEESKTKSLFIWSHKDGNKLWLYKCGLLHTSKISWQIWFDSVALKSFNCFVIYVKLHPKRMDLHDPESKL